MDFPEDMVELAAQRAWFEFDRYPDREGSKPWSDLTREVRQHWREIAQGVLTEAIRWRDHQLVAAAHTIGLH